MCEPPVAETFVTACCKQLAANSNLMPDCAIRGSDSSGVGCGGPGQGQPRLGLRFKLGGEGFWLCQAFHGLWPSYCDSDSYEHVLCDTL